MMKVIGGAIALTIALTLIVAAGAVAEMTRQTDNNSNSQITNTKSVNGKTLPNPTTSTTPTTSTQNPITGQSTGTDSSGQTAPAQNSPTVNITNHAFDPAQLNVPAGTIVTWTNNDTDPHTVNADNGLFDSGVLQPGQSYSTWLGGSGTVAYHCQIHPDMQGSVVVGGGSSGGGTTTGNPASSTPAQTGTTTGNPGSNPPNQSTSVYP